jgi:NAD-dependent deacetylase
VVAALIPERALERLRSAKRVLALTGAGISAESGVPTFRDAQTGLWAKYRAEELATPEAFEKNPRLVWEWYSWRRELVGKAEPNAGHHALVTLEQRYDDFTLVTQNVDGLHERAGSRNVVELHGNIARTLCFAERTLVATYTDDGSVPPRCPRCGAPLRPGVVWFGEALPAEALASAHQVAQSCDVALSIGTSSLVEPAASLPLLAKARGAYLIEINPTATPLTPHANLVLAGPAGQILPELAGLL